ncbi:SRPBCC family protein [Rhizobium sp. LjRoot254]|uniref:SRPBCC family protein n=1 Tax=Rhizobium sp. LjRoot254 TaxID=3342297 RepID=UPI003ED041C6
MNEHAAISDLGTMANGSTLIVQRLLPGPAERVWKFLVDGDLRSKWLAAGDMQLAPGAALELVWRNDSLSRSDDPRPEGFPDEQRMQSHVVSVDPMRLLTIAWGNGNVTFELKTVGDKVLLVLTHSGLDTPGSRNMIAAGWHVHLDIMIAKLSDLDAPSFWSTWAALKTEYGKRLAQ